MVLGTCLKWFGHVWTCPSPHVLGCVYIFLWAQVDAAAASAAADLAPAESPPLPPPREEPEDSLVQGTAAWL